MMVDSEFIGKAIKKYQGKYDKAYLNYQETGESRYYRAYTDARMMIDALSAAISVANIKGDAVYAEGEIASWAGRLINFESKDEEEKKKILNGIAKEIISADSLISFKHKSR
ncbi:MAG: hypothetical protein ACI4KR_07305 [Ruminiclostridium sp.]